MPTEPRVARRRTGGSGGLIPTSCTARPVASGRPPSMSQSLSRLRASAHLGGQRLGAAWGAHVWRMPSPPSVWNECLRSNRATVRGRSGYIGQISAASVRNLPTKPFGLELGAAFGKHARTTAVISSDLRDGFLEGQVPKWTGRSFAIPPRAPLGRVQPATRRIGLPETRPWARGSRSGRGRPFRLSGTADSCLTRRIGDQPRHPRRAPSPVQSHADPVRS